MAVNFHPVRSLTDDRFDTAYDVYRMIFNMDAPVYGGHGRLEPDQTHLTLTDKRDKKAHHHLSLYLPSRTGIVLQQEG